MTDKDIEKMKSNIDELVETIKLKQEKIQDLAGWTMQLQVERNEFQEKSEQQERYIKQLETELEVKENLLKIKNTLCENENAVGFLFPSEPIKVAEQLINATYTREKSDMEKAIQKVFGNNSDTVIENVYSLSELRQIAEHLLVYCDHNSED